LLHGEESPLVRHAAEDVKAAIPEAQPGARDQILDGAGDENLAGVGEGGDPRPDLNGNAPSSSPTTSHSPV